MTPEQEAYFQRESHADAVMLIRLAMKSDQTSADLATDYLNSHLYATDLNQAQLAILKMKYATWALASMLAAFAARQDEADELEDYLNEILTGNTGPGTVTS